jgi:hypothetical protein
VIGVKFTSNIYLLLEIFVFSKRINDIIKNDLPMKKTETPKNHEIIDVLYVFLYNKTTTRCNRGYNMIIFH